MDLTAIANAVASAAPITAARADVVPGRTVHVDADMLAYWAGGNADMPASKARSILVNKVDSFIETSGAEQAMLHLTASGSLKGDRVLAARCWPYQANRAKAAQAKPHHWAMLRQWMTDGDHGFRVKQWEDREADDGFGWITTSRPNDVIATQDKDMQRLPGWRSDWKTGVLHWHDPKVFLDQHPVTGKWLGEGWFWMQMLSGDDADHIPGLLRHASFPRGVGPKTAEKLIKDKSPDDARQTVITMYKDTWGSEWADHFVEQGVLLWIRSTKAALIDEFMYSWPIPIGDAQELADAMTKLKRHVQTLKEEAAKYATTDGIADQTPA